MNNNAPIGVIDSGVGGLSVLKCLRRLLPGENFVYLGDTARTPYGSRSEREIRKFAEEMLCWLDGQGVKMAVIACNTLTMLGVDSLQGSHSFPLIGMSKGEGLLLSASRNKKIGIFATPFTIGTEAHRKAVLEADGSAEVFPVACPAYVPLIEGERFDDPALERAVVEYSAPLKEAGVDALILGCTHYPFIKDKIARELGTGVAIVDPAEETALLAGRLLETEKMSADNGGGRVTVCCTADPERVERLAARMLPSEVCSFREITLAKQ